MKQTTAYLARKFLGCAIIGVCALSHRAEAQAIIQQWNFNEANGTTLNNTTNSVSGGSSWSAALNAVSTNGTGLLVVSGYYSSSARATAPIAALTSGIYQFDVVVAGWDLTGVIDGGSNLTSADAPLFEIGFTSSTATTGAIVANISLDATSTGFTLSGIAGGTGGTSTPEAEDQTIAGGLVRTTPITFRLLADFSALTYSVSNSDTNYSVLSTGTLPSNRTASFLNLRLLDSYSTSSGFSVDQVTLTAAPEPSTVGLALLGIGALTARRQRRLRA